MSAHWLTRMVWMVIKMETDSCCNRSPGYFIIWFSPARNMSQLQCLPMQTPRRKVWSWNKTIGMRVISHCKHLINGCCTHGNWNKYSQQRGRLWKGWGYQWIPNFTAFSEPCGLLLLYVRDYGFVEPVVVPTAVPGPDGALSPGPVLLMLRPDEGWCCSCAHLPAPWGPPAVTGPQTSYVPTPKIKKKSALQLENQGSIRGHLVWEYILNVGAVTCYRVLHCFAFGCLKNYPHFCVIIAVIIWLLLSGTSAVSHPAGGLLSD